MKISKILFVIFSIILIVSLSLAEEITLNVGESKEISGNTVKLKSIKSDKVVVTVNEESKIIETGKQETIGPLKIRLIEIFYITQSEGNAKIEVTSLYTCGDSKCEGTETKSNCCQDCGCQSGYDCEDNECLLHVEHQCNKDEECNDNNQDTSDRCTGYPRKCQNKGIAICDDNLDCDDNDKCTIDKCVNSDCRNERIEGCKTDESPKNKTTEENIIGSEDEINSEITNVTAEDKSPNQKTSL